MRRRRFGVASLVAVALVVAGCGSDGGSEQASKGTGEAPAGYPRGPLKLTVPTPPSGGGQIAAEAIASTLEKAKLANVQTMYRPGGSGTVGFTSFALENKKGDNALMIALPALISNPPVQGTDITYESFTPVARLFSEYDLMTVKADSAIKDLDGLAAALKKSPKDVRFFGGSVGSADHILVAKFAEAAGIPIKDIIYVGQAGADSQIAQLLGGHTDVLVGGTDNLDLVASGEARALGVSSPERLEGAGSDVPTFTEQGYEVVVENWRSLVGPGDMPKYARDHFVDVLKKMTATPEWQAQLKEHSWTPTALYGDEFGAFLDEASRETETLLKELGLIE